MGIATNTLSNAETGPYAVISVKRVSALADALGLDVATRARLLELHQACPMSPFAERRRERWAKAKADRAAVADAKAVSAELAILRDAARHVETLTSALVRLLERSVLEGCPCDCDAALPYVCELCDGMRALGVVEGWRDPPSASEALLRVLPDGESSTATPQPVDTSELEFG